MNEATNTNTTANISLPDDLLARLREAVYFCPVKVTGGRKFKGFGYVIAEGERSNGGYAGSGVRPLRYYTVARVWTPAGKFDEYNKESGREEEVSVPDEVFAQHFNAYVFPVLENCRKRCGSDMKWRANYLNKVLFCGVRIAEEVARAI